MERQSSSSHPEARVRPSHLPHHLEVRSVPGLPKATMVLLPEPETRSSKASELRRVVKGQKGQDSDTSSRGVWIWSSPVTCRQYTEVTGTIPESSFASPDAPVERVSWFEALLFCDELSRRLGLPTSFNANYNWRFYDSIVPLEVEESIDSYFRRCPGFRLPFVEEVRRLSYKPTSKPPPDSTRPYQENTSALVRRLRRSGGTQMTPSPENAESSGSPWYVSPHGDVFEWTLTPGESDVSWMFVKPDTLGHSRHPCIEGYHRMPQVGFRPVLSLSRRF